MKMPNGKGMIGLAKERLVRAVNQVLGIRTSVLVRES